MHYGNFVEIRCHFYSFPYNGFICLFACLLLLLVFSLLFFFSFREFTSRAVIAWIFRDHVLNKDEIQKISQWISSMYYFYFDIDTVCDIVVFFFVRSSCTIKLMLFKSIYIICFISVFPLDEAHFDNNSRKEFVAQHKLHHLHLNVLRETRVRIRIVFTNIS